MNDFEFAKERAKKELNNPLHKDVFVTVPDGAVYLNSSEKGIKKHLQDNNLKVIHLKIAGVLQSESNELKKKNIK